MSVTYKSFMQFTDKKLGRQQISYLCYGFTFFFLRQELVLPFIPLAENCSIT